MTKRKRGQDAGGRVWQRLGVIERRDFSETLKQQAWTLAVVLEREHCTCRASGRADDSCPCHLWGREDRRAAASILRRLALCPEALAALEPRQRGNPRPSSAPDLALAFAIQRELHGRGRIKQARGVVARDFRQTDKYISEAWSDWRRDAEHRLLHLNPRELPRREFLEAAYADLLDHHGRAFGSNQGN